MSRGRRLLVVLAVLFVGLAPTVMTVAADTGPAGDAASLDAGGAAPAQLETSGHSLKITSSAGADAAMYQTVTVQENTSYTLSGWIKTENVQNIDGMGAQLNVHELGQASLTSSVTGTSNWTYVETTINSSSNTELQINALLGGWGNSTGTAYYDDIRFENPSGENLLTNGDFESGSQEPWSSNVWQGGPASFSISDQESVATGEVATRSVEDPVVRPGESTQVTVTVDPARTTDFTVVEHFSPAYANVEVVDADGAEVTGLKDDSDGLFATFTDRDQATLVYEVTLPKSPTAVEGDRFGFAGYVHSSGDRSAVGGTDELTAGISKWGPTFVQSTRSIDASDLGQDRTATVTVTAQPGEASNFTIFEEFGPTVESVRIVDADGANFSATRSDGGGLYAAYSGRSSVTLVYEVTGTANVNSYSFDGRTLTDTAKGQYVQSTLGPDRLSMEGVGEENPQNGNSGNNGGGSDGGSSGPDVDGGETPIDVPEDETETETETATATDASDGDSDDESGDDSQDVSGDGPDTASGEGAGETADAGGAVTPDEDQSSSSTESSSPTDTGGLDPGIIAVGGAALVLGLGALGALRLR